jgi:integrase
VWHLALAGLRRGELCGLRWTDIDFETRTISIEITRVVVDPLGRRYHPDTASDYWAAACAKAGVKRIRLHDARHTCGTLMHLEHNVPVAIISAWLGHADTAFTMRTYVHNQPETLAVAADSISLWTRRKKSAR